MVTKNGETYIITISLEEGDLEISNNSYVEGDFKVEMFEKDFGTFDENASWVENVEATDLFIDNKSCPWEKVSPKAKNKILKYILSEAKHQLDIHLYGS